MIENLKPFFTPQGVGIIGASSNPGKLSHGILKNMTQFGYRGNIYPVNPASAEILGLRCYADISNVPDPIDLAVIILPAPAIAQVLTDCAKRGIKAVIIISGGFREIGNKGLELENECVKIAREHAMRIIGPNCVGTMNLSNGLDTTFIMGMPAQGGIGFVSQSGAVCGGIVDHVVKRQIGFSHLISLGNEADVNETDIIAFLGEDKPTRVIAAYVESIREGQRFLEIGKKVALRKPIVILKAGRTNSGARAVSSHTGSLAGAQEAYSAAFKQAGMIEVKSLEEMLNVAMVLDLARKPLGNRAALITNAGGPAALASDVLADNQIDLAGLSQKTKDALREHLNPSAQVENPVDMLGGAEPEDYGYALHQVLADGGVDIVIPILVPQALVNPTEVARAIISESKKTKKPVVACLMGKESIEMARKTLLENGIPMLDYPEQLGKPIGALVKISKRIEKATDKRAKLLQNYHHKVIGDYLQKLAGQKALGEYDTRPVIQAAGIPLIEGDFAKTPEEALAIADRLSYPIVLKIVSPDILHKSEVQGIALNVSNGVELKAKWEEMVRKNKPKASISGFMVEKMAKPGQEVIIGMKRDVNFGPLLLFGLGGVAVELFKDVSFRIAQLTAQDAKEMIQETHSAELLKGFRGQPKVDRDAIVECLLRLSRIVVENAQIEEIEINPLLVYPQGEGVLALDCRMIVI